MKILRKQDPAICFGKETIFADHAAANRSGHLGHAMVECADGSLLAFYMNTSGAHNSGHTMYGWVEYKRSLDRGESWGEARRLPYSWDMFLEGIYKIGCEKAVVCNDGTIVLFCLRGIGEFFEPYATPVCLLSHDNGESWSEPVSVSEERGRIYDALYHKGRIYVLEFCNSTDAGFTCNEEGKYYRIYASDDSGQSFYEWSTLFFNTLGHAYGNLILRDDESMVFYGYNVDDEYHLTAMISEDLGKTWSEPFKIPVAKIARNPQVGRLKDMYILHGRSEGYANFVFYTSRDGIHWDEGTLVNELLEGKPRNSCYYSNNLTLTTGDGKERMLVQYSELYEMGTMKNNIMHAWVECE